MTRAYTRKRPERAGATRKLRGPQTSRGSRRRLVEISEFHPPRRAELAESRSRSRRSVILANRWRSGGACAGLSLRLASANRVTARFKGNSRRCASVPCPRRYSVYRHNWRATVHVSTARVTSMSHVDASRRYESPSAD